MIEDNGLVFTNLNGQSAAFNNDIWPLKKFEVEGNMKSTPVDRMQEPGEWPVRTIPGSILLHCGGDVLKNDSAGYIAERMRVLNILIPAGVVNNERKMGVVTLLYVGWEPMIADWTLDDYPQLPMEALYPSVTEWGFTIKVFAGYMIGRGSGRLYSI
jgi:hypothetical protein